MFSKYLESKHDLCKELVNRLDKKYAYVSILGKQIEGSSIVSSSFMTRVGDTHEKQCGFVVRYFNGYCYSEYSFSDITSENIDHIEKEIINSTTLDKNLLNNTVKTKLMDDTPLVKSFYRPVEGKRFSKEEILAKLTALKNKAHSLSKKIINAYMVYGQYETSSMFISKNRDLKQDFTWTSVVMMCVAREEENIKQNYGAYAYNSEEECFKKAEEDLPNFVKTTEELLHSEAIVPGVYDIITAPSITGLIAHEAFGHGVEMDMFVKHRARSRHYINKRVASPLINMHDGAASILSSDSYFFDDDGVLAHDTLIIKNGILQTGISDAVSAMELGTEPTGNGRRQDTSRKAYTRMTNTFFEPGNDNLEDMIKSIKHGYMLFQTDNGMEDPKNWNIQCTASYGREIVDGKFSGKIVAPVVMSGYVLDLLNSITMVSKDFEVIGSGHCGKGYKEWVTVSDGGPYLKARCKLG